MKYEARSTNHAARCTLHESRGTNHEARILVMAMMVLGSSVALAMPTQQELKKAQPLVAELMAPTMDDFKAKKKTAADVADMAVKYAGEAETEAAKFMLYRSSIPYYVRGEAYDKAADAVEQMKANVKDVPASVIEEIISKATVRATAKKAPRLFELYRQAKTQSVAEKDIAAFRAKLKKNPGSLPTLRNLAEALATFGDWDAALKEFAKLKDSAAQIAKKELDGSAKSAELGEFWWGYKPTYENADDVFEMHAAVHYRKALAAGEITGLKKSIIERRVAEYSKQVDAQLSVDAQVKLFVLPKSGRGPEVKLAIDEKHSIDFASCPAGEFKMGFKEGNSCLKFHSVKISRPFWIATLPLSYGVLDALIGKTERPFGEKCDFRLDVLGGDETPAGMSHNKAVATLSVLNAKFARQIPRGYVFRLATEAEYEYVVKSGHSSYNVKVDGEGEVTTFQERLKAVKAKGYDVPQWEKFPWRVPYFAVGTKKANAWNVKDMLTAGWAYTLDTVKCDRERDNEVLTPFYKDGSVDPVQLYDGPHAWCVMRGCGWGYDGKFRERGWIKFLFEIGDFFHHDGVLRVVIGPDLVSEWKAKNGKK